MVSQTKASWRVKRFRTQAVRCTSPGVICAINVLFLLSLLEISFITSSRTGKFYSLNQSTSLSTQAALPCLPCFCFEYYARLKYKCPDLTWRRDQQQGVPDPDIMQPGPGKAFNRMLKVRPLHHQQLSNPPNYRTSRRLDSLTFLS
jgi:hypothetical protein